ncbi:MAG: FAD-binding protein [Firmicutes bacterium]|nr:FAD-binding protein [Bacillota bacterium]
MPVRLQPNLELAAEVVVVGSGVAGLWGSLANTALSGGGFTGSGPDFSVADHALLTRQLAQGLAEDSLVECLAAGGEREIQRLSEIVGTRIVYVGGGRYELRSTAEAVIPGKTLTGALCEKVRLSDVRVVENATVLGLMVKDGQVGGLYGVLCDGDVFRVTSGAIVLATGGYAGCVGQSNNAPRLTGDGHMLALNAGGSLRDLEYIQFHPLGIEEPHLPSYIVPYPFPRGTRLESADGRDLIASHFGPDATLQEVCSAHRDELSFLLLKEKMSSGSPILRLGAFSHGDEDLFCARLLNRYYPGEVPHTIRVGPVSHFTMGGVAVDRDLSVMPGLFAAGEIVGGLHGANRYSGNALTAGLVQGRQACLNAARYSKKEGNRRRLPLPDDPILRAAGKGDLCDLPGRSRLADLKRLARRLAWSGLGPIRSARTLETALGAIRALREEVVHAEVPKGADLALRHFELLNMVLLTELATRAAAMRRESRGSHRREDFPQSDGAWQRSIFFRKGDQGSVVTVVGG